MLIQILLWALVAVGVFFYTTRRFWLALRTLRAMTAKRFRWPMSTYGYEKLDEDRYGAVWELAANRIFWIRALSGNRILTARTRILEVRDASTGQRHWLGVPLSRETSTARGAVAWSFGLQAKDYHPDLET